MNDISLDKTGKTIIGVRESVPVNNAITLQPVTDGDFKGVAWRLPDNIGYFYTGYDASVDPPQKILVPTTRMKG